MWVKQVLKLLMDSYYINREEVLHYKQLCLKATTLNNLFSSTGNMFLRLIISY